MAPCSGRPSRDLTITRILTRLFTGLALVFIALIVMAFVLPSIVDQPLVRQHLQARLASWTGGELALRGPIALSYFPSIALRAEEVELRHIKYVPDIAEVKARAITARLDWWPLLLGRLSLDHIEVEAPHIELKPVDKNADRAAGGDRPEIVRAVKGAPMSRLIIRRGTIALRSLVRKRGPISAFNTDIVVSRGRGSLAAMGDFVWNGEPVSFKVATSTLRGRAGTARAPIELSLKTGFLSADFIGNVTVTDSYQLMGDADLKIDDLRRLALWFDTDISPRGAGHRFSSKGKFSWIGKKLDFTQSRFALDGNEAEGTLTLKYGKRRPKFEGTMAFNELHIVAPGPLIAATSLIPPIKHAGSNEQAQGEESPIDFSLLRGVDADLLVSASTMRLGRLETGNTAFTLTIASDGLKIDIAALDMFEGRVNGRVEIVRTRAQPVVTAAMTFREIATARALSSFGFNPVLTGLASGKIELDANGEKPVQWLASLKGRVSVDMMRGGRLALNVDQIFADALRGPVRGWSGYQDGVFSFARASAMVSLSGRKAQLPVLYLASAARALTGSVRLDLVSGEMSSRLWFQQHLPGPLPPNIRPLRITPPLILNGSWRRPVARLQRSNRRPVTRRPGRAGEFDLYSNTAIRQPRRSDTQ